MKKLLFLATMLLTFGFTSAQISDVRTQGDWIYVYDAYGKGISHMQSSGNKVVGVASSFFVVLSGDWIYILDENCKGSSNMQSSGNTVVSASGNSFSVRRGDWVFTLDKYCKGISQRLAN